MDSTTTTESPHSPRADLRDSAGSSSAMIVESSKLATVVIVLAVMCGLSLAMAVEGWHRASEAEMKAELLKYYLLELDAKFISYGFKKPEDSIAKKLEEKGK